MRVAALPGAGRRGVDGDGHLDRRLGPADAEHLQLHEPRRRDRRSAGCGRGRRGALRLHGRNPSGPQPDRGGRLRAPHPRCLRGPRNRRGDPLGRRFQQGPRSARRGRPHIDRPGHRGRRGARLQRRGRQVGHERGCRCVRHGWEWRPGRGHTRRRRRRGAAGHLRRTRRRGHRRHGRTSGGEARGASPPAGRHTVQGARSSPTAIYDER